MNATKPYRVVLFDWGDTIMKDDPASDIPMMQWPVIEAVDGIETVLEYLKGSGRRIALATSAVISDEDQIRGALGRVNLDRYFHRVYCFKNTGLSKGKAFYQHILNDLNLPASEALMVGDGIEKDVLAANQAGIFAVWFNPRTTETRSSSLHTTVHSMEALLSFFTGLDATSTA
jgi:FMN phosphatase YigB (HAD superfamily)